MNENIALRMKFLGLRHTLHSGNLRQDFPEQAAFVEHAKRPACMPFRQHPSQFVADAFARHNVDLMSQPLYRLKRRGVDTVFKSCSEPYRSHHAQLVLGKTLFRMADRSNNPGS